MTCLDTAQRAAGEDADADRTHGGGARPLEQQGEILAGKTRWQRAPGAGIEEVVTDLRRVEDSRIDDAVKLRRLTEPSDPEEADLALAPQGLKGRDNLVDNDFGLERPILPVLGHPVVELQKIDLATPHSLQAGFERLRHRSSDAAMILRQNGELGADEDIGTQRLQDASKVLLRFAISISRGRIEVADPESQCARHRTLLIGGVAADHEPADGAAAETEHRELDPGLAERALFHRLLLFVNYAPGPRSIA